MNNSTGCKIVIVALFVAIIAGGVGFGAGYITHSLLSGTPLFVSLNPTATPSPLPPSSVPTDTLPPPAGPSATATAAPSETPPQPSPTPRPEGTLDLSLFYRVWALVSDEYYGEIPPDAEVVYGAIQGALNTLGDPYTGFLDPDAAAASRRSISGSYGGIGAMVSMEDGYLTIVSTFRGSPAEAAGLRRGDIILQADDTVLQNMGIYEAINYVVGPPGTTVRLKIAREGTEPFEVVITRAQIEVPVTESEMRDDGIAYVRYNEFSDGATDQLADAIQDMLARNPKGLILDLRGNPGGLLGEAVRTAGLFLPRNSVVLVERDRTGEEKPYRTLETPRFPDIPLVLLVDAGSASASEIVAGALKDAGRATLVGETTFGKGAVQWPHDLEDGSQVRITVSRFFSPDGHEIHGVGVAPDIEVEMTEEDLDTGLDPQLDRAAQYLLTGQ